MNVPVRASGPSKNDSPSNVTYSGGAAPAEATGKATRIRAATSFVFTNNESRPLQMLLARSVDDAQLGSPDKRLGPVANAQAFVDGFQQAIHLPFRIPGAVGQFGDRRSLSERP